MPITVFRAHNRGLKLLFEFIKIRLKYAPVKVQIIFYFLAMVLIMFMLAGVSKTLIKDVKEFKSNKTVTNIFKSFTDVEQNSQ